MAISWKEVTSKPEFKSLSFADQEATRNLYFSDVVAPQVDTGKLDETRASFDADTTPTKLDRVKGSVSSMLDAVSKGIDKVESTDSAQSLKAGVGSLYSQAGTALDNPAAFAKAGLTAIGDTALTGYPRLLSQANKWAGGDGSLPFGMDKGAQALHDVFDPAYSQYAGELSQSRKEADATGSKSSELRAVGNLMKQDAQDALSPEAKARDQEYAGTKGFEALGYLAKHPGKLLDMTLENLPSQAPMLLTGYGGGLVMRGIAGRAAMEAGTTATSELLSTPAFRALGTQAEKDAAIAQAQTTAGNAAAESAIKTAQPYLTALNIGNESFTTVAQTADAIHESVAKAKADDLQNLPLYQQYLQQTGNDKDARALLAANLTVRWAPVAGMGTAFGSIVTGGAKAEAQALAGQVSGYKQAAKGVGKEMLEETIQNPLEDLAQHTAQVQVDPTDTYDPIKSSIEGAAVSMGHSGAVQFAKPIMDSIKSGRNQQQQQSPPPTDQPLAANPAGAPAAPAPFPTAAPSQSDQIEAAHAAGNHLTAAAIASQSIAPVAAPLIPDTATPLDSTQPAASSDLAATTEPAPAISAGDQQVRTQQVQGWNDDQIGAFITNATGNQNRTPAQEFMLAVALEEQQRRNTPLQNAPETQAIADAIAENTAVNGVDGIPNGISPATPLQESAPTQDVLTQPDTLVAQYDTPVVSNIAAVDSAEPTVNRDLATTPASALPSEATSTPQVPLTPRLDPANPPSTQSWTDHPAAKKLQAVYETVPQNLAGRIERAQDDLRAILERTDGDQMQGAVNRLRTTVASTKALAPLKADIEGVIAEGVNRALVPNRAQYEAIIQKQESLPQGGRDTLELDGAKNALKLIEKYGAAQGSIRQQPPRTEVQHTTPQTPAPAGVSVSGDATAQGEPVKPKVRSLLDELKRSGVMSSEVARDATGMGKQELAQQAIGLGRKASTKGEKGRSIDHVATWMVEHGWMNQADLESVDGGASIARARIANAEDEIHPSDADEWYSYVRDRMHFEDARVISELGARENVDSAEVEALNINLADESINEDFDIPFGDGAVNNAALDEHFGYGANNEEGIARRNQGAAIGGQTQGTESTVSRGAEPQAGQGGTGRNEGFALQGQTNAEIAAQERAAAKAAEESAKEPPAKHVTSDQADMFATQNALFNSNREQPAAESKPEEILVQQPYGVNTLGGIAEFEQAKEAAASAPENTIVRVRIDKEGLYEHEPVKTLYGAFVANGDGTATWAQARFPASKENPSDAQIMDLAEADRLSNKESDAKIAEQAHKNKAALADKGIVVGLELQSPSTYVLGKKGMTTFTRAKVVAIDDHGIAEVHATLKGSGKTYAFKADAHSRLFEKLESNPTQEQQATALLDRANVTGKDRLDIMRDFKDGKHSLADLEKAYPAAVDEVLKPAQEPKADQSSGEGAHNTSDAGAELTYNKRNRMTRGIKWEDIQDKNESLRVKEVTKAKVYPKPDYEAIITANVLGDEQLNKIAAHIVKQVYDSIANVPNTRTATDEQLQEYITGVNRVMDGVMAWANNKEQVSDLIRKVSARAKNMRGGMMSISALAEQAPKALLETVYPNGYKAYGKELQLIGGNKPYGALQPGVDNTIKAMKDIEKGWPAAQESWQRQGFAITPKENVEFSFHDDTRTDGTPYSSLNYRAKGQRSGYKTLTGETVAEARAAAEAYRDSIGDFVLTKKNGDILGSYATEEEATEAARAAVKREAKTDQISEKGWSVAAAERIGVAHRMEGENIDSDKLKETFGFKGVNFGNWMKGDTKSNVAERQAHLNHAYDAFLDLAEIIGVPPKAMSLNGMLGLAIGAQGSGKNLAHFVPGVNEINLTRTGGAGALAHEWAHALDHYFSNLAGLGRKERPYLTEHANSVNREVRTVDGRQKMVEVPFPETLRPEVLAQFQAIVQAMTKKMSVAPTEEEAKAQTEYRIGKEEKQVELWLKSIRRDFESPYFAPGRSAELNEVAKQELLKTFDALASKVRSLEVGDGLVAASSSKSLYPVIAEMRDAYKKATGRVYSLDQAYGLYLNVQSLKHLKDGKYANAEHVPRLINSNYQNASLGADKETGRNYWATKLEMFARAFDAYVVDTLAEKAAKNSYLSGIEAVAPAGEERKAIGRAFDFLLAELKTKDTDSGVAMFSKTDKANATPQTVESVTKATAQLRARWLGFRRIQIIKSVKEVSNDVYLRALRALKPINQNTEGVYDPVTNTVWLIADNLASPERAVWVAIHEVAGHGGIRMLGSPVVDALNFAAKNGFVAKLAQAIAADRGETFDAKTHTDEAIAELAAATITGKVDAIMERYGVKVPMGMRSNLLGMIKRVVDAVRNFIGRVTGKPVEEVSDGEVLGLIRQMKDAVEGVEQGYDTAGVSNGALASKSGAVEARSVGFGKDAALIADFRNDQPLKRHADYKAAKAGDIAAAVRLVSALVKPESIAAAKEKFGDDVAYLPVMAQEASGKNQIPNALARHYAEQAGGSKASGIFQTNKAYHTGADAMERMIARSEFGGEVIRGQKYVLVDDVSTMGGTLADLASYIQANGGVVSGAILLTNASRTGTITPDAKTIRSLGERHGQAIKQLFGIEPSALTRDESQYLIGFRTTDELRNRAATASAERGRRILSKAQSEPADSATLDQSAPLLSSAPKQQSTPSTAAPVKNQSQYGMLTPEQARAISEVVGQPKTLIERAKEFGKDWQKNMVQGIVDQYAPIKELNMTAYIKARMTKGSASTLEAIFMYGKPRIDANGDISGDFDSANGGKNGFASVLAPLDGEHDRFLLWVAALRADRLKSIGLENLWSASNITELKKLNLGKLQNGNDRMAAYAKALQGLNEYNDAVLKIASERGLINDATRKMYQDTPYVPFYRLSEEDVVSGFAAQAGMVNQTAWKKLKGGTQKLNEDLLANLLQNWSHLIEGSGRNDAAKATLTAAVKAGAATEVPNGYPGKGTVSFRDNVVRTIPAGKEYEEGGVSKVSDGTAKIEENTERTFMVSDPHLMDAITSIGNTLHVPKVMKRFKHMLTVSVTANPAFKLRNLIRDSVQSMALAELSYNPVKNINEGRKLVHFNSETRAKMLFGGGIIRFGSMLDGNSADMARELVNKGVPHDHILDNDSKIKGMWDHYIKPAFDAYQEFGDRGEQVNRAALFAILTKPVSEGGKGMTQGEANYWARDLMDFSMSGKWTTIRFLTQTVPFMNARLQGLYKLGKAAKADKARFGYVVGGVAMASLMLLAAYSGDDDWKKREDWDRDNYWWFKVGGHAFRIPKPFEIGAIGTIAERSAELMFDKEMTGIRFRERLGNIVSQQLSMSAVPQLFKPMYDLYANKDSFSGRPIETMGMEKLKPADRAGQNTSGVAKLLGSLGMPNPAQAMMGNYDALSPVQIDFLIKGYFSWLGMSATTALDHGIFNHLGDKGATPDTKLKDVFFVGNFAESLPSGSSRYVTQMYDQANEIEQAYNSYHAALKLGDRERAADIMASDKDKIVQYHTVEAIKRTEGIISNQIKAITNSKTMSGEDKRARIDKLNQQKDGLARRLKAA